MTSIFKKNKAVIAIFTIFCTVYWTIGSDFRVAVIAGACGTGDSVRVLAVVIFVQKVPEVAGCATYTIKERVDTNTVFKYSALPQTLKWSLDSLLFILELTT